MGRGNVCVTGSCEGLYYIDNDDFHVYRRNDPYCIEEPETRLLRDVDYLELTSEEWHFDELGTSEEEDDVLECFMEDFCKMFPSFEKAEPNKWIRGGSWDYSRRVILESKLFYICVEDNQWSLAVELIQKEEPWGLPWMENLQSRLYQKYLEGMKKALLNRLPGIGTYSGAWTSGRIKREECLV